MTPVHGSTVAQIAALILTGSTLNKAELDTASGGGKIYRGIDDGDVLGIGDKWNVAEFNIFGQAGGAQAHGGRRQGVPIIKI
jgi:hypothetical protein